jgi:hypothetical protein
MDDSVTGKRSPADARAYYAKEFLDYRRKQPTPYMDGLRFTPGGPDEATTRTRRSSPTRTWPGPSRRARPRPPEAQKRLNGRTGGATAEHSCSRMRATMVA